MLYPPCYFYCGSRNIPLLLLDPPPRIVKHHSIIFIHIADAIVKSKKAHSGPWADKTFLPKVKARHLSQLGQQGGRQVGLGGGPGLIESGIDGAAGPDHGYGKICLIYFLGGRRWPWSPRMITRVLSHKGFLQIVHIFFEAIIGIAVGIVKRLSSSLPAIILGLGVSKGSWLVRVSTTWKKGLPAGRAFSMLMPFRIDTSCRCVLCGQCSIFLSHPSSNFSLNIPSNFKFSGSPLSPFPFFRIKLKFSFKFYQDSFIGFVKINDLKITFFWFVKFKFPTFQIFCDHLAKQC